MVPPTSAPLLRDGPSGNGRAGNSGHGGTPTSVEFHHEIEFSMCGRCTLQVPVATASVAGAAAASRAGSAGQLWGCCLKYKLPNSSTHDGQATCVDGADGSSSGYSLWWDCGSAVLNTRPTHTLVTRGAEFASALVRGDDGECLDFEVWLQRGPNDQQVHFGTFSVCRDHFRDLEALCEAKSKRLVRGAGMGKNLTVSSFLTLPLEEATAALADPESIEEIFVVMEITYKRSLATMIPAGNVAEGHNPADPVPTVAHHPGDDDDGEVDGGAGNDMTGGGTDAQFLDDMEIHSRPEEGGDPDDVLPGAPAAVVNAGHILPVELSELSVPGVPPAGRPGSALPSPRMVRCFARGNQMKNRKRAPKLL